jgi:hypothetical protein
MRTVDHAVRPRPSYNALGAVDGVMTNDATDELYVHPLAAEVIKAIFHHHSLEEANAAIVRTVLDRDRTDAEALDIAIRMLMFTAQTINALATAERGRSE